jgi:membrane-anchored glycerophosphoryl diester phosphodiesterase (GDPDase)
MTGLELRPRTLGEILDRTFSLYRRNFVLFMGIVGIPHLLMLAFSLAQLAVQGNVNVFAVGSLSSTWYVLFLVGLIVGIIAYLFSQGGTIFAVSQIYLGRPVTISEALGHVWGNLGFLFGVVVLNSLAVAGATLLLIIPGIYVGCRLLVCVPAAVIEEKGPRESLSRSWDLTRDFTGRAFMIFLFYLAIAIAAGMLFSAPFTIGFMVNLKDPAVSRIWLALNQVSSTIGGVLTTPLLLIATSIFYYDLRVRKEAFDLQLMMDPTGPAPSGPGSMPSIL